MEENDKLKKESGNAKKPISETHSYQIDFGNHLKCKIKVANNVIEVEGAMNGWGDVVPLSEVVVVEM